MRRLRAPPASLCREGSQAGAGDARGCCGAGKETGFNFLRPLAHASKVPLQAQCCWGKQLYWGLKPRVWLTYDSHTESCSWRCSLQRPLGARLNACRATHPVRPVHRNSHSTPSLHHSLVQRRRSPPPRRIKCMLAAVAGWPLCAAQPQLLYPSVRLSSSKSEPSPRHAPLEADTDGQGLFRISGCLERRPRTHSWRCGAAPGLRDRGQISRGDLAVPWLRPRPRRRMARLPVPLAALQQGSGQAGVALGAAATTSGGLCSQSSPVREPRAAAARRAASAPTGPAPAPETTQYGPSIMIHVDGRRSDTAYSSWTPLSRGPAGLALPLGPFAAICTDRKFRPLPRYVRRVARAPDDACSNVSDEGPERSNSHVPGRFQSPLLRCFPPSLDFKSSPTISSPS